MQNIIDEYPCDECGKKVICYEDSGIIVYCEHCGTPHGPYGLKGTRFNEEDSVTIIV